MAKQIGFTGSTVAEKKLMLDDLDLRILRHLEEDGRRSYSEMADDLGVAVSTVSARVTKLIDRRVVSIEAFIDSQEVGLNAPAILLLSVTPKMFDQVAATIIEYPEVNNAVMVTGPHNLIVDVFCRNAQHLSELLTERLHHIDGIQDITVAYQLKRFDVKKSGVDLISQSAYYQGSDSGLN